MAPSLDAFIKACADARVQVEAKKNEYKAEKKKLALTNPQE